MDIVVVTFERKMREIATRCMYVGTAADDYSVDCQQFGIRRRIKWDGQHRLDEWRLCSTHRDAMLTEYGDLIVRIDG